MLLFVPVAVIGAYGLRCFNDAVGTVTLPANPLGSIFNTLAVSSLEQLFANGIDAGAILEGRIGQLVGWKPLAESRAEQVFDFLGLC